MKFTRILLFLFFTSYSMYIMAQSLSTDIRLNQIGFLPNSKKIAAVVNTDSETFKVMTEDLSTTVLEGHFLPAAYYSASEEFVKIADFTILNEPGHYVLVVENLGKSVPFQVGSHVFTDVSKGLLKYYYYNRASMALTSDYAGVYARAEGHPDTQVIVHPSAATTNRPAGTIISTPGGWYDAGDYNKYIVSSGISVFTLLSAYETYSSYYDTLDLNIPESGNTIPDILDEALYNIRWMMTMQDEDGGVYNKTTEANFSGFVMPNQVTAPRYVTAKGTAATLDFSAIMAMTARIYRPYDSDLADKALEQALKAWEWAKSNPAVEFNNPGASGGYPGINTGGYGDTGFDDEFTWCAAELYITTDDPDYYDEINFTQSFGVPGWPVVASLGLTSLIVHLDDLSEAADKELIKSTFLQNASGAKNNVTTSPYRIPGDFYYWAGNNAFANWGMIFMQAFRLTSDASYFNAGVATFDYLLGKNATTYSFVTGFGSKTPMHVHHRISSADGIAEPIPGMLAGGANSGNVNDDCGASSYPSLLPAKAYLDSQCSYSTNEVAIGINAPLAFLAGAIQSEYLLNFIDSAPIYLSVSTNGLSFPYKKSEVLEFIVESNTDWGLTATESWIVLSQTEGNGIGVIEVNSDGNNPAETDRNGKIYVYRQGNLADSILVTQNGVRYTFRIEAEDYLDASGTQTETTGDFGGGENIGYVDAGDWLTYNLDITVAGVYAITFRHAGWEGDVDMSIDGEVLANIAFPATADWQTWESAIGELSLNEGQHVLKLTFNAPGINFNWMLFNWERELETILNVIPKNGVRIYPNPAQQYLMIDSGSSVGAMEIQLISMDGKILMHRVSEEAKTQRMDISHLNRGVYLLKATYGSRVISETILVY